MIDWLMIRRLTLFLLFVGMALAVPAQRSPTVVTGKLYFQSKGNYPAANMRLVLMPNTKPNLTMAQNANYPFDPSLVQSITGAREVVTSSDGTYRFSRVGPGNYILRAEGIGGNYLLFTAPENTPTYRLPDMPADYGKKRLANSVYMKKY
jgi:hypothetical protein